MQGRDAASGSPGSLVVLLHGYGSSGRDFAPMAERLSAQLPDAAFLYPNAPEPWPHAARRPGYSWFDFEGARAGETRAQAREYVTRLIAHVSSALAMEDAPVVLVGFSQGGGVAVSAGSCAPDRVVLAVAMAGVVDAACDPPEEGARPRILMVHNDGDERVPVTMGEQARDALVALGYAPKFTVYPGDTHWPSPEALADVEAAIVSALADAGAGRSP
ncbi:MAG: alpha/beta fold hydrolase [Caulobacterales bacterium]|nr:alpha/beta fold hydrolase [Caulobacterales bacterium]